MKEQLKQIKEIYPKAYVDSDIDDCKVISIAIESGNYTEIHISKNLGCCRIFKMTEYAGCYAKARVPLTEHWHSFGKAIKILQAIKEGDV